MKKSILVFFLISFIGSQATAQRQIKFFTNTKKIEEDRYEGIRGTPFLFKDWKQATIIDNKDSVYSNITLNYNAYEGEFEVLHQDEYISLDVKHYKQITVADEEGDVVFKRDLNPKDKGKFYQVVYSSDNVLCYLDNSIGLAENTIQDYGKTVVQKKFKADPMHHFKIKGATSWLRITKKNITQLLGGGKDISTFIKKNKIKVANSADLAKLLAFYDSEVI